MRTEIGEGARVRQGAAIGVTAIGCMVVGSLADASPALAVAVALAAVAVAVAVAGPSRLLLAIFPAIFMAYRVGPAGLNLSGVDVVLGASTIFAVPLVPWRNVHVRQMAWAMAAYLAILLVTMGLLADCAGPSMSGPTGDCSCSAAFPWGRPSPNSLRRSERSGCWWPPIAENYREIYGMAVTSRLRRRGSQDGG